MARQRLYGWNGETPAKNLVGQAQVVMFGLSQPDGDTKLPMRTAKEWAELIGPQLKTRQDPYRVVLYYILGLKKLGVIATREFDIDAVTKSAEGAKHAVTVVTDSMVQDHGALPESIADVAPEPEPESVPV